MLRCLICLLCCCPGFLLQGQTRFFTSFDDTRIAYTDEGKGKPVLLIHGFINTGRNWDKSELKKELLKEGYRVIVPDLRGNGDSDKPQDEQAYSQDSEILDLMFLMAELNIRKYTAVGYSRGSILLARLLTKDRRVKKAVLGGMGIDFTNPLWERRLMFRDAFKGKPNPETQEAVDYALSIGADLRSLYLQQKYQPVTTLKQLAQVKSKVLVIAGDEDLDNGDPRALQEAIPKSRLKIVPGDHTDTYTSAAFAKAIIDFL